MSILIGGSPSTGSSLLRRVLNRHSKVFCGSETSIFAKEGLYKNWDKNKSKLLAHRTLGLPNAGWHHYKTIDVEPDYLLSKGELSQYINESKSLVEFSQYFYSKVLDENHKLLWAEKTPSNAFTLHHFLESFPNAKVVHITRDPLDCIASLVNRGKTVYDAISVYLLNTAKALELNGNIAAFLIKYEDLTREPEKTLTQLMQFLDLEYESKMLIPDSDPKGTITMNGWQYNETDSIQSKSVGRFYSLEKRLQVDIIGGLSAMSSNLDCKHHTVSDIAHTLDYTLPDLVCNTTTSTMLHSAMLKDKMKRLVNGAYFRSTNYPINLSL